MDLTLLKNNKEKNLIAVSKVFASAQKQMNAAEFKTFIAALTKIKFTKSNNSDIVTLDKKKLAKLCGLNSDEDHLANDIKQAIQKLPDHSGIRICARFADCWESGVVVNKIHYNRGTLDIHFNHYYMPLFQGLIDNYITLFPSDIFQMKSSRTIVFYENLRLSSDTCRSICTKTFSFDCLKQLFDIPNKGNGSYVNKNGKLDVATFEKAVIKPLISDMEHCKMIKLIMNHNGKYYEKIKEYGKVIGFSFSWKVKEYNKRRTAQPLADTLIKSLENPKPRASAAEFERWETWNENGQNGKAGFCPNAVRNHSAYKQQQFTIDEAKKIVNDLQRAVEKTESSKTDYIYTDKAVAKMNKKVIHNDFSNEWVEEAEDFQTYLKRLEKNYLANIKD